MRLPDELYKHNGRKAAVLLVANVTVVAAAGIVAYHVGNPVIWILAYVLVGARGQACYILQHEAMHGLLFASRRLNDRVGDLFWPRVPHEAPPRSWCAN